MCTLRKMDFAYPTHTFLALFSSSVCLYLHLLKGSFDNKMELNYTAFTVETSLCYEDDPTSKAWNQDMMWQHILECFEVGQMTPFPLDIQTVKNYEELEDDSKTNNTSTYQIH